MNTETLMREVKGNLFVGSSRVSLQTVITARKRGETPEQIRDNFPSLTLAEVYGAILYYLEHQAALDTAFAEQERALDEADATNRGEHARFFDTMHSRFEAS
jgi:uncharacterized protein (DUF433 family)